MPPSTDNTPDITPATIPTSSNPDTCLAAITATITGRAFIKISKTSVSFSKPGILLTASINAIDINPGKAPIIIPLKFILLNTFSFVDTPEELPLEPITGLYFILKYLLKLVIADIALVLFVVPVVPETAITFAPLDCKSAIEAPPVPTIGIFLLIAASILFLLIFEGSQLINISPSILPLSIILANSKSYFFASSFISDKVFTSVLTISPFSSLNIDAFAVGFILSIGASAPINKILDMAISVESVCNFISDKSFTGSLPPKLYKFPPLLPMIAIFFIYYIL